jgi:hypothetical protein
MALGIGSKCLMTLWPSVFLANFTKFQPEKYDLNLYNGFPMEKMTQNRQNSKEKKPQLPDLYDKFQEVAKNIEEFRFFSTFISSM